MRKLFFIVTLLSCALPAGAGTYIQSAGGTASSSTTVSATFPSTTTTGNLIIVSCFAYDTSALGITAADGGTNTFIEIRETRWNNAFGNSNLWTGYVENATGKASHQITCTAPSNTFRFVIWITEVSGILTSGALDQHAGATGSSTTPNSGNTATTTQANELLYGAVGVINAAAANPTVTAGTNYTLRGTQVSANGYLTIGGEDRNVTSTGTYPADFTLGTSQVWGAHVVTFKDASAASRNRIWNSAKAGTAASITPGAMTLNVRVIL